MLEIVLHLKQPFTENKIPLKLRSSLTLLFLVFAPLFVLSQSATIKGIILDDSNAPIEDVTIKYDNNGTISNE